MRTSKGKERTSFIEKIENKMNVLETEKRLNRLKEEQNFYLHNIQNGCR